MAYDRLVESMRLLAGASPASQARLSRRVRHVPLALDREEDVAVTMFLRRGVNGVPELDVHILELSAGGWRVLGSGGGPGEQALGARRCFDDLMAAGESRSGGGMARSAPGRIDWGQDSWVSWAQLRLAQEVAGLRVGDRRLPVAAHGLSVVVWTTTQAPLVTAVDSAGVVLGRVPVGAMPSDRNPMPAMYRDA